MRRLAIALLLLAAAAITIALVGPDPTRDAEPEIAAAVTQDPTATSTATAGTTETVTPTPTPSPTPHRTNTRGIALPDPVRIVHAAYAFADTADPADQYTLALQLRDAGQYATAIDLFREVAGTTHALAPMAELRLAQTLVSADRGSEAADVFASVIAHDALPTPVRSVALLEGADALQAADRTDEALSALTAVESIGPGASTRASARWARAELLRDLGDPAWTDLAIGAMNVAPGSGAAVDALDALDEANIPTPPFLAAYVNYLARRNDAARAIYEGLLAQTARPLTAEEHAAAWFYVGALDERSLALQHAVLAYGNAIDAAPFGPLADDARYWRGRVSEELGDRTAAIAEYDRLLADYPTSGFVPDARERAGIAMGLAGNVDGALDRFEAIATDPGVRPEDAANAARWHEVFRQRAGSPRPPLEPAVYDPTALGAVLERSGIAGSDPVTPDLIDEVPVPVPWDPDAVAVWLGANVGPRALVDAPLLDDPDLALGLLLARVGEDGVARTLLFNLLARHRDHPYELVDLIGQAEPAGLYDVALRAATTLLGNAGASQRILAPRTLLAVAYPVPYLVETLAASSEFDLPPLLLLALVRQESAFDPHAGSVAGAVGLTQVIAPTGRGIAQALGEPWNPLDLLEPAVSLRYGAFYLAENLRYFDADLLPSLAAYNGGPGNAARWLDAQPFPGPDAYVYTVDFSETRRYLPLVLENYAMYRYVYAGAEAPSLR